MKAVLLPEVLPAGARLVLDKAVAVGKAVVAGQRLGRLEAGDGSTPLYSNARGWVEVVHYELGAALSSADAGRPLLELSDTNPCRHDVVINKLCAACGEPCAQPAAAAAAPVDGIRISRQYAEALSQPKIKELFRKQKLMLVLDLDHTLVHAEQLPPPAELLRNTNMCTFDQEEAYVRSRGAKLDGSYGCLEPDRQSVIDGRVLKHHFEVSVDNVLKSARPASDSSDVGRAPVGTAPPSSVGGSDLPDTPPDLTEYIFNPGLPENEAQTTYCHYVRDAETLEATRYKIRTLESSVFYLEMKLENRVVVSHYKLRPGVIRFLRELSHQFELYIYTAGIKEHAEAALRLLDPERRFFGPNCVFSREAVSKEGVKSLSRVLPSDHHAIVVVDDTPAAWDDDVGLIVCYPYVWFSTPLDHFAMPQYPFSLDIKVGAFRRGLCQYTRERITNALTRASIQLLATATTGGASSSADPNPLSGDTFDDVGVTNPLVEQGDALSPASSESSSGSPFDKLAHFWETEKIEERCKETLPARFIDSDLQLFCLVSILRLAHRIYYAAIDKQVEAFTNPTEEDVIKIPTLKDILDELRSRVLKHARIYYGDPPMGWNKTQSCATFKVLGAEVIHTDEIRKPTHILLNRYDKVPDSVKTPTVTQDWLEYAASTFLVPDDAFFTPSRARSLRVFWDACEIPAATNTAPRDLKRQRRSQQLNCAFDSPEDWYRHHGCTEAEIVESVVSRSTVTRPAELVCALDDLEQELLADLV